ncbi:rfbqrso22-4-like protein [Shewanella sediminis HAW-EB3]|uniref:Rfbqrso22-4-like protein n=1 Tax=Shewanella sediminis (strain HAW-EB3) TaxID=425104 RepID=A8FXP1_SHESH|nr:ISAs1 family transposase [Shewanella sediminis]ABV37614.1 rfbqrso22-4-like protein [Shewanella sediminis HAW-EB3]
MNGWLLLMRWSVRGNVTQKILEKAVDYLLAVKGNQGSLASAFDDYFDFSMLNNDDIEIYTTKEQSRGRHESRAAFVSHDLSVLGDISDEWPGLKSMAFVVSMNSEKEVAEEADIYVRYYISSKQLNAEELLTASRLH